MIFRAGANSHGSRGSGITFNRLTRLRTHRYHIFSGRRIDATQRIRANRPERDPRTTAQPGERAPASGTQAMSQPREKSQARSTRSDRANLRSSPALLLRLPDVAPSIRVAAPRKRRGCLDEVWLSRASRRTGPLPAGIATVGKLLRRETLVVCSAPSVMFLLAAGLPPCMVYVSHPGSLLPVSPTRHRLRQGSDPRTAL